jgi:hypothetical protein
MKTDGRNDRQEFQQRQPRGKCLARQGTTGGGSSQKAGRRWSGNQRRPVPFNLSTFYGFFKLLAAINGTYIEHDCSRYPNVVLRCPPKAAEEVVRRCTNGDVPGDFPLHAAAHGCRNRVIGSGGSGGKKIRTAGKMVYSNQPVKKYFAYVEAGSAHGHVIVESKGSDVEDLDGLIVAAEITLGPYPSTYIDDRRTLEAIEVLAGHQGAGSRVEVGISPGNF